MAFEGGISKLSLNSDAASTINDLNGDSLLLSEVALMVEDIKDLVHRFNGEVSFTHSSRSTNRVVHSLTKLALVEIFHRIWVDDSNPSIRNLILEDSIFVMFSFS
ncbi:hypothetical protein ACOSQ4_013524 [Xanthoceras sorbifolium]